MGCSDRRTHRGRRLLSRHFHALHPAEARDPPSPRRQGRSKSWTSNSTQGGKAPQCGSKTRGLGYKFRACEDVEGLTLTKCGTGQQSEGKGWGWETTHVGGRGCDPCQWIATCDTGRPFLFLSHLSRLSCVELLGWAKGMSSTRPNRVLDSRLPPMEFCCCIVPITSGECLSPFDCVRRKSSPPSVYQRHNLDLLSQAKDMSSTRSSRNMVLEAHLRPTRSGRARCFPYLSSFQEPFLSESATGYLLLFRTLEGGRVSDKISLPTIYMRI